MPEDPEDGSSVSAPEDFYGAGLKFERLSAVSKRLHVPPERIVWESLLWLRLEPDDEIDWRAFDVAVSAPRWSVTRRRVVQARSAAGRATYLHWLSGWAAKCPRLRRNAWSHAILIDRLIFFRRLTATLTPERAGKKPWYVLVPGGRDLQDCLLDGSEVLVSDVYSGVGPGHWHGKLLRSRYVPVGDFWLSTSTIQRLAAKKVRYFGQSRDQQEFETAVRERRAREAQDPSVSQNNAILIHILTGLAVGSTRHPEFCLMNGRPNADVISQHIETLLPPNLSSQRGANAGRIRKIVGPCVAALDRKSKRKPDVLEALIGCLAVLAAELEHPCFAKAGVTSEELAEPAEVSSEKLADLVHETLPGRLQKRFDETTLQDAIDAARIRYRSMK